MNSAVACGHIDANPARGVKRNRRPELTRFLSREEIGRLHRILDAQTEENNQRQADIIRLLLLIRNAGFCTNAHPRPLCPW